MTDLNFLMVVLGGWGLCDEIGNGEVVQQLWSSFLSILFQQSDCIQNWCYTDTSHSYFHRSSICTGKEGARLNLAGLIRNCLRMFGFLEIGWQQSSASLLIEEQRALWFGSSSGGSAWELGSILRCGSMAAVGEASLSNIPDIWGALPCHHLLRGPALLWQRKQKIIILVKLETENQFTLLDILARGEILVTSQKLLVRLSDGLYSFQAKQALMGFLAFFFFLVGPVPYFLGQDQ